jgi:predicted dehydrogenase
VGVGDITTKRVLPAILEEPRSKLAGIVTRTPVKAEIYGVTAWTSLERALSESEADAVYIGTPVVLHAPQTIACLRAGRHVLCEKPMAISYAEAVSMTEAAKAGGRTLGISYYRRTYPVIHRASELIDAGAIGTPIFAMATSHDWMFPDVATRGWLIDPAMSGGGPLYDVACHRLDLMNYLFGDPVRASGHLSTIVQRVKVEDNATVLVDHNSGVRSVVDVRWHSRVTRDEFLIRGTDGEMDLSPLNSGRLVYPGGEERHPPNQNVHYPCIENFVASLLDGTPLLSTGVTALKTDWITEQVMRTQSASFVHMR